MRRNAPGPASTKMRGVPSRSTMKLEPALPNARGPPEPSTTTSNAGFAGAARRQVGKKTATATASAISLFMAFSPGGLAQFRSAPIRLTFFSLFDDLVAAGIYADLPAMSVLNGRKFDAAA